MRITKNSVLTNEQKKFIIDNYSTMNNNEISEKLNIDKKAIRNYAKNLRLIKDLDKKLIKHGLYEKILQTDYSFIYDSMNKVAEPKVDEKFLYRSKYGKYRINQNYFNNIDNEWKAYWLGFLYADGCNRITNNRGKTEYVLKIALSSIDKNHLKKMIESLQSDTIILDKKVKCNNKEYNSSNVSFCNKQICEMLNEKGCTPNKSLTLTFPNNKILPKELIRHFIRGYFDGDGCVHINLNNKSTVISFVGTKEFLMVIQDIFHKELNINYTKLSQKQGQQSYQISYGGIEEFEKIFTYLYKDSNICLDRKLEKFKIIL